MKTLATIGQPAAIRYASSYKSNTSLAANTAETVFSAASNTLGAWLWRASFVHGNAGGLAAGYLAKTSAPTTVIDGDVICGTDSYEFATNNYLFAKLEAPVFIPPGKGLYFIAGAAEVAAYRAALFTLLT